MTIGRIYGRVFFRGAIQNDLLIAFEGHQIIEVTKTAHPPADAQKVTGVVCPGFIDIHVHGGGGADFMDGDPDANGRVVAHHARHGTTALAATTLSASPADLQKAVRVMARSAERRHSGAAEIVAIHLEGPFINAERAGAQDRASIRTADIREMGSLLECAPRLGWISTIAPEIEGALLLVARYRDQVKFAIVNKAVHYGDAVTALSAGATHFTHLFNAMTGLSHREPGIVGAALTSTDATAELIADGIHVHPAVLRLAALAMPRRIALVTDAMRACGLADGTYKLYGYDVEVAAGSVRLADGTIAGSVLTMDRAVQNMVELAGLPLESVLPMATEVPARIAGVAGRKGFIEVGLDADLVILGERLEVERVVVRGKDVS